MTDDGYRRLVERSPDGICVQADGQVVFVNDTGVRLMLADSSEQLVGRPITDFVASDSLPPIFASIAELREVGDCTPPYRAQMIRMDGSLLAVEVRRQDGVGRRAGASRHHAGRQRAACRGGRTQVSGRPGQSRQRCDHRHHRGRSDHQLEPRRRVDLRTTVGGGARPADR